MKLWRSLNKSLLLRIVTMFMAVLLPAYICIGVFSIKITDIIRQNALESTQKQVEHELASLQGILQQIHILQEECINELDLYSIALTNQFFTKDEEWRIIGRLQNRLSHMRSSNRLAEETYVYIYSLKKVVSSTTTRRVSLPFDINSLLAYYGGKLPKSLIFREESSVYLLNMTPRINVNARPFFLTYTLLSQDAINRFLQTVDFPLDCTIALYDHCGQLIGKRGSIDVSFLTEDQIIHSGSFLEKNLLVVSEHSDAASLSMVVLSPEKVVLQEFYQLRHMTLVSTGLVSILTLLFAFSLYHMVYKPLTILHKAFQAVEAGSQDVHITYRASDEFCGIYDQFNKMVNRLHVLIRRVYQQELENKRSELKQLQSQINPHFLYNCFFIIYRLSKMEDMDTLSDFSRHMGEYFQYVTRNKSDVVALSAEIKHAQDYVHIQDIRFSNRIDVDFQPLPEVFHDLQVPRFMLQPILENCYEHGFSNMPRGGKIDVRYAIEDQQLHIIISNSGASMSQERCDELLQIMKNEESDSECTGIINVSRRLKLMYQADSLLHIRPGDHQEGVVVTLRIPLEGESTHAKHADH